MEIITTVGYGGIYPGTEAEKAFSIFWIITGVLFYTYSIGKLTQYILNKDDFFVNTYH